MQSRTQIAQRSQVNKKSHVSSICIKMKSIFQLKNIIGVIFTILVLYSCANRGMGPQGGPKDEVPPKMVKSTPPDKSVNVSRNKIELEFDENVNLKDIASNVIISPPQRTNPDIRSYGKKVSVEFKDTLQENTTYSINFGDAVVDNNEGNILKNFVFSFATGDVIDTMQISGVLINAEDLNPMKGIMVGIHSDLSDSAFLSKPFSRVTRSGDDGKFTVSNVKNNKYRVYALGDLNRDYFYQQGEGGAFLETVFETGMEDYIRQDTVWKDSVTVDTILSVNAIRYLPDDVVLKYFKDDTKRQYLAKTERTEPHKLNIYFNTLNESEPELRPLNVSWDGGMLLQKNERLDTLTVWLADSLLIKKDTITVELKYLKSDSLFKLQPETDTINFSMRRTSGKTQQQASARKKKEFLQITTNVSSNFDVFNPINISFNTPIKSFDRSKIQLSQLVDTLLVPVDFKFEKKDSVGMNYVINHNWTPESRYQLLVDSAAFVDIYNLHNDNLKTELRIKSLEEYSSLSLVLEKYDPKAVFQIVTNDDRVVRTVPAQHPSTKVEYLQPGDYYVRMFLDENENGKWDTGSISEKRQPEEVFYYSKKLTLIKNWEFEETWDHTAVPLLNQKPEELKKTIDSAKK